MPPKPVPLAYAGRKLTGPPEGYDKKKELQVKKWLTSVQQPPNDGLSEVASVSEVGVGRKAAVGSARGYPRLHELHACKLVRSLRNHAFSLQLGGQLDPTLDELYENLRDSTDGGALPLGPSSKKPGGALG